ncbi:MAG: thioredoxin family protein [Bacilli bacterium]|nr:thioredoxin family protein [Bacilli bacterium]
MKKEKKILTIAIILLIAILAILLINNLNKKTVGELKKITYEELTEKQANEEDFILIVSTSTCSHCATYKPKVKEITKEYGITVYYIDYDKISDYKDFLNKYNLTGATPTTLFFKDGEEKSLLNRIEGDLSTEIIIKKFKKMGFITE